MRIGLACVEVIGHRLHIETEQAVGLLVLRHGDLGRDILGAADLLHLRGAMHVVEQGAHAIEAHRAEELLVVELPFRALVNGVPLVRDVAEGVVEGHSVRLSGVSCWLPRLASLAGAG